MDVLDETQARSGRDLRRHWYVLISLALAVVFAPEVFTFVKVPAPGLWEQRVLAARPSFPKTLAEFKAYPLRLDAYIQDNFGLRQKLIVWANIVRYRLGYSGSKQIIVGRDGWLFYDDGTHLKYWRGERLTDAEADAWVTRLRALAQDLQAKGIKLYLIYPPYKPTVYPEKLPSWLRISRRTMLDQVLEKAKSAGLDGYVVDVRQPLIAAKTPSQELYFKYDSHWNSSGSYIAYRELMLRMQRDFADLSPHPITEFPLQNWPVGDLAGMLGIGTLVPPALEHGENPTEWPTTEWLTPSHYWAAPHLIHTQVKNGRTLVIMRDSYTNLLLPYLASNFERIAVGAVADRNLLKGLIADYRPDAVVLESIEEYCSGTP